jgi:hypothetical protein
MTKDEALDLALAALTRYVNEDDICEGMPGNEPWVETKYMGEAAITAIKQALALDKKAENARELGLDYEPADGTQVSKVWWDGEKLMAKPIPLEDIYQPAPVQEPDCVSVPRDLVGAACAAIEGKRDAPKTLEQLRRYTTGDLSTPPAAQPAVPLTDDTRRLDALAKNSWDLRCFDMSDDDIGWRVIEHHMAKPHERTVAEVFRDDPRQAIDAAIEAAHGITKGQP